MQRQRPTKLTAAALLALTNGILSLIGATLAILGLVQGGILDPLGRTPLMMLALLLGTTGVVYVALGTGLWQQSHGAHRGSLIAGAAGIPVGLVLPIPVLSAIMNLVMILLLRGADVRAVFEEADMLASIWATPTDLMEVEQQPSTTGQEWQPTAPSDREPVPLTPQQEPGIFLPESVPPEGVAARTQLLEKEPEHMAWLIPTTGPRAGTEFRLRDVTTVGRDAQNDIVLEDEAISGRHLRIRRRDEQFVLHDLATTNGTIVNGEQVLRHPLTDGDLIKIGNTTLLFMEVVMQHNASKD